MIKAQELFVSVLVRVISLLGILNFVKAVLLGEVTTCLIQVDKKVDTAEELEIGHLFLQPSRPTILLSHSLLFITSLFNNLSRSLSAWLFY